MGSAAMSDRNAETFAARSPSVSATFFADAVTVSRAAQGPCVPDCLNPRPAVDLRLVATPRADKSAGDIWLFRT
jgi:hypothetical protein